MGDRSGSREPKGASLKKSRKNPGASAAKVKKVSLKALGLTSGPIHSLPPSLMVHYATLETNDLQFDCGVALLSRQFDRDRDRVLQRALTEGKVCGMLIYFADIEKQTAVADYCKDNSGYCYYATGVHADNIDRTNKKSHDEWLEKIEDLGRRSECLAILTGLNLSREVGNHFSQEAVMKSLVGIAGKLLLPLMVHLADKKSLERFLEVITELHTTSEDSENVLPSSMTYIIHDILTIIDGDVNLLQSLLSLEKQLQNSPCTVHFYYSLSGAGICLESSTLIPVSWIEAIQCLSLDRVCVCSDGPWKTPQNLPDPYLRTLRNEPANLPAVVNSLSELLAVKGNVSKEQVAKQLRRNVLTLFGLDSVVLASHKKTGEVVSGKLEDVEEEEEESDEDEVENEVVDEGEDNDKREEQADEADEEEVQDKQQVGKVFAKAGSKVKENKKDKKKNEKNNKKASKRQQQEDDEEDEAEKQPPPQKQQQPTVITASNQQPFAAATASSAAHYKCMKCRHRLFASSQLLTHAFSVQKTVFKVGEEGLCTSFYFLSTPDARGASSQELSQRLGLSVGGGNVECVHCSNKLGKYSLSEPLICPCGALIPGPVVKINALKLDYCLEEASTEQDVSTASQQRSKVEVEDALRQREIAEQEALEEEEKRRMNKKAQRVTKHKSENKGNFSNFRNKSFVPNASKIATGTEGKATAMTGNNTKEKGGKEKEKGKKSQKKSKGEEEEQEEEEETKLDAEEDGNEDNDEEDD